LGFTITKESYAGSIKEITIGKGDKAVTVGGESCYPFYQFEGDMPNKPRIAMEIWDIEPTDWPQAALEPFKDVVSDPAAWAKKCVNEYGAELIVLQLKSIDPNDKDASPQEASATVKKVLEAVDVPLIVWGCANPGKDEEVLKVISEENQGANLTLGPVEDTNHKGIGASAMGYGHTLIASSPIDVNLAKQVNILLENLGMPMNKILVDPTTGGLGYGMEYSYSVMERLRMAAMAQGDDKLQFPIINNLGNEIWKCKEVKQSAEDAPVLGDPERRGIMLEAIGAVSYILSGSDILIMRHPEAIKLTKSFIDLLSDGGSAMDIAAASKLLEESAIDFAAISPQPDLTIEEEKAKPVIKQEAAKAPAAAKPAAAPKPAAPAAKPAEPAKPAEVTAAPAAAPAAQMVSAASINMDELAAAIIKAEKAAKAAESKEDKTDENAAAKAKVKADADAKAKAEATKKAAAEARLKRDEQENEIRLKRAEEKAAHDKARLAKEPKEIPVTPAKEQLSQQDKLLLSLNMIHKRIPLN
jgi:acetyl-CoA decarbonylase/synthase complex subunit delta